MDVPRSTKYAAGSGRRVLVLGISGQRGQGRSRSQTRPGVIWEAQSPLGLGAKFYSHYSSSKGLKLKQEHELQAQPSQVKPQLLSSLNGPTLWTCLYVQLDRSLVRHVATAFG